MIANLRFNFCDKKGKMIMKNNYITLCVAIMVSVLSASCVGGSSSASTSSTSCDVTVGTGAYQYTISNNSTANPAAYTFCQGYPVYDWNSSYTGLSDISTSTISIKIGPVESFSTTGHYYAFVYVPTGNVSWVQAAYLASKLGGYLATPNTSAENDFIYSTLDTQSSSLSCSSTNDVSKAGLKISNSNGLSTLMYVLNESSYQPYYVVDNTSADYFFYHFPIDSNSINYEHNGVSIGPWLGGFQPDSSYNSNVSSTHLAYGWKWIDGTDMTDESGDAANSSFVNFMGTVYNNGSANVDGFVSANIQSGATSNISYSIDNETSTLTLLGLQSGYGESYFVIAPYGSSSNVTTESISSSGNSLAYNLGFTSTVHVDITIESANYDLDYRNNNQPNASGSGSQPWLAYGEANQPTKTWGDFNGNLAQYGDSTSGGSTYGFIVEFDTMPTGSWVCTN